MGAQCVCWRNFCYGGCAYQASYWTYCYSSYRHLEFPSLFLSFTLYSLLPPGTRLSCPCTRAIHSPLLHQECFPLSSGSSLSLYLTFRSSFSLQSLSKVYYSKGHCRLLVDSNKEEKRRPQKIKSWNLTAWVHIYLWPGSVLSFHQTQEQKTCQKNTMFICVIRT